MKHLFAITVILTLSGCSLFKPKEDAPVAKERMKVIGTCPDHEACKDKFKSGVICEDGSHHSDADHCPLKK